ncbi:MAG: transcriptional regulator [Firmicutes bacterium]|nr:transcriptional regulator [Bacillota bacterium]
MPKSENQKLRILYLLDYLQKNSHEEHPVRAKELMDMLMSRHDIRCDRKTIYSDIAALQEYGYDIASTPGKNGGYYMVSQIFQLPELKLLIDAVQSSRYLTEKKSRELIEKLCRLCNEHDANLMKRNVLVAGRVKSMNESIYYNIDAIQEAISRNRQITFRYFDWDLQGKRRYRDREYKASPYGLIQDNENCYLLAYSVRHGVTHYRVDRMSNIISLEEKRLPCPELTGKALNDHARKQFQMFSGEEARVRLRFRNHLANVVFDRFGQEIMLVPDGENHFVITVSVDVSPMFLSWVIGFGDDVQILFPESVAQRCRKLCQEVAALYSPNPTE